MDPYRIGVVLAAADEGAGGKPWPWLALAAIGLALVSPALMYVFVRKESEATQKTVREGLRLGRSTTIIRVQATGGQELTAPAAPTLTIDGPDTIEAESRYEYSAIVDGTETKATWAVAPAGFVTLPERRTGTVTIRATKAGSFTLSATSAAGSASRKTVTVTPTAPAVASTGIPSLGQGWGSIVIAMFVAAVVTALGMVRVLSGQALATLFGSLMGYVFHKAADERDRRQSGPGSGGGGATSTGGRGGTPSDGGDHTLVHPQPPTPGTTPAVEADAGPSRPVRRPRKASST